MAIVDTLDEHSFINRFLEIRDNFSTKALKELYYYYEGFPMDIEFDPIAICCDWSEYRSHKEALEDYGLDSYEELEQRTVVIPVYAENILVQNF